jgi:hypothetical protein
MNATDEPQAPDTEALNVLIRGEMAAVETYTQALGTFDDELLIANLQRIRDEHSRAVRELRDQVILFGGAPPEGPPAHGTAPWGTFATAASGSANTHGPATVLAALRQGEEHEVSAYEEALENPRVPLDCHGTIRTGPLLACRQHIEELNRLLGGATRYTLLGRE